MHSDTVQVEEEEGKEEERTKKLAKKEKHDGEVAGKHEGEDEEEFASKEKRMREELESAKQVAYKVSCELETTKGELVNATAKGNELGDKVTKLNDQLLQSQKEHKDAVEAGSVMKKQLEGLKGDYTAKVQECENTLQTANEEFASKEKRMREELESAKQAADKISFELETTKGELEIATTKGKELGNEVKELKNQMFKNQNVFQYAIGLQNLKPTTDKSISERLVAVGAMLETVKKAFNTYPK